MTDRATLERATVDREPRCAWCGRLFGKLATRPWLLRCRDCKRFTQDGCRVVDFKQPPSR